MLETHARKWLAFTGIALLSFGAFLDYTIVNIALPVIQTELKTNLNALQWVMNIYFLVLCILATIMGRCGDLYGRRRMFYMGSAIFGIASVLAGMAPSIDWLIAGRFLQDVGAALGFLSGMLSAVALFFDPLYLQIIKGQSPQLSGLVLFSIPVTVVLVSLMVGWLIHRLGMMNTILMAMLIGILATLLHAMFTANSALVLIIIAFIFLGAVWAMYTVSIIATQTVVGPARASVATGTIVTMFNMGGSIGLAVAVVIYHIFAMRVIQSMPESVSVSQLIENPASFLQTQTTEPVHTLFSTSFMHGFSGVMWFLCITVSAIFLCTLLGKATRKSEKPYASE